MSFLKSKKGFLFTLAAILFATTLVIYSQTYLSVSYDNEKAIINSSAVATLANINDGVSFNMLKIVGLTLDVNTANDLNIYLYERVPKGFDVLGGINDFESMLNNQYFKRVAGMQSLDASALKDGVAEVFVGEKVTIESDYVNKITRIYPNTPNQIVSIDLNIYADAISELSTFTPALGGVSTLTLRYVDNNAQSAIVYSTNVFNPSAQASLLIDYVGDNNVLFLIGNTSTGDNSFYLDSNLSSNIYYSVRINYADGATYLPVRLNGVLSQSLGNADSNSMLKIIN